MLVAVCYISYIATIDGDMDIWFNVYVIVVSPSSIISFEQCGIYYYARVFGNWYVFVLDAFDGWFVFIQSFNG